MLHRSKYYMVSKGSDKTGIPNGRTLPGLPETFIFNAYY